MYDHDCEEVDLHASTDEFAPVSAGGKAVALTVTIFTGSLCFRVIIALPVQNK